MAFVRSTSRGSKYAGKTIDPLRLHISYEGKVDEADYFDALVEGVPRQFKHLLHIYPVDKSTTNSAPKYVYDDLMSHIKNQDIKLKNGIDEAFIVIDKDHHFTGTHMRETGEVLKLCRDKGIHVICSNPCLELWLLCHYIDVSEQAEKYKNDILSNRNDFLKKQVSSYKNGETYSKLIKRLNFALENESKLYDLSSNPDAIPPEDLVSNIGKIWKTIRNAGIDINKFIV